MTGSTSPHLEFIDVNFLDLQVSATDSHDGLPRRPPLLRPRRAGGPHAGSCSPARRQKRDARPPTCRWSRSMKVLPVFFGLISLQFPAGLVLYFFVSNLWRLGQQEVIFRKLGTRDHAADGKGAIDVASRDRGESDGDGPAPKGTATAVARGGRRRATSRRRRALRTGAATATPAGRADASTAAGSAVASDCRHRREPNGGGGRRPGPDRRPPAPHGRARGADEPAGTAPAARRSASAED